VVTVETGDGGEAAPFPTSTDELLPDLGTETDDPFAETDTTTETVIEEVPVPEGTVTDLVPIPGGEETVTEPFEEGATAGLPTTTGDGASGVPAVPDVYSVASPGPDIGVVSIDVPSNLDWTGTGEPFVLIDRASGATLVDSTDVGGRVPIEPGEYDLEVAEGTNWLFAITER